MSDIEWYEEFAAKALKKGIRPIDDSDNNQEKWLPIDFENVAPDGRYISSCDDVLARKNNACTTAVCEKKICIIADCKKKEEWCPSTCYSVTRKEAAKAIFDAICKNDSSISPYCLHLKGEL